MFLSCPSAIRRLRSLLGIGYGISLLLGSPIPVFGQAQKKSGSGVPSALSGSQDKSQTLAKVAATERAYYTVCMNLIQREWEAHNRARVLELLEETKDSPYRSFEWGYWNRLCHREMRTLKQPASAVAVSADGRWIATADWDATVQVWDAATGQQIWTGTEKPKKGWAGLIMTMAFTPDGKRLVTSDSQSTMVVWDAQTGAALRTLFGGNSGTCAAFSQDGSRVVLNARGTWGAIRELETGTDLLKNKNAQYNSFASIAFAPDATRFVTCSDDNVARLWDARTGEELRTFEGHQQPIASVAFSPDGKRIATGSSDRTVKIWDVQTGRELRPLAGSPGEVWVVRFSPDGKSLVTGSTDGTARLWDTATGKEIREFCGHTRGVGAVAFFPDGTRLVTGSGDGTTKIWDLTTGDEEVLEKRPVPQSPPPVTPEIAQARGGRGFGPRAFSADDKRMAVVKENNAVVWDIPTGKPLFTLEGHKAEIDAIAFSPDSQRIATGSIDNTAKIWDARTGKLLHTLTHHSGIVTSLAFLPDNRRLVTGSEDGTAKVWNSASGQELRTLHNFVGVASVEVLLDGSRIVTGSRDKLARVWDSETGRQVGSLEGGAGLVGYLTLSADSSRAVSYYPFTIQLWNVTTGKAIRTLPINAGFTRGIAFSPDHKRVVVGNSQGDLAMWDVDTGKPILTWPHSDRSISAARFSPDGRRLLLDCSDGSAYAIIADFGG